MTMEATGREYSQFVGGEWVQAEDGRTFEDIDPYTDGVVAQVPAGGRRDARRAARAGAGLQAHR